MSDLTRFEKQDSVSDEWTSFKIHTAARIALGRTGVSVPMKESLEFKAAHAMAREAVYSTLDHEHIRAGVESLGLEAVELHSRATTRQHYLQMPYLGRKLDQASVSRLSQMSNKVYRVCFCIADGLSATASNQHARHVLSLTIKKLQQEKMTIAPVAIIEQGRVAIADEVGYQLKAEISVILIGERPGLSSPDSLGIYLTYDPKPGKTDESRNCISNVRPQGLSYELAADKLFYLITQSLSLHYSGVNLKDNMLLS
jgi:ethanolamine ammonia-lyase small subunit